jgi:hypothetical protein
MEGIRMQRNKVRAPRFGNHVEDGLKHRTKRSNAPALAIFAALIVASYIAVVQQDSHSTLEHPRDGKPFAEQDSAKPSLNGIAAMPGAHSELLFSRENIQTAKSAARQLGTANEPREVTEARENYVQKAVSNGSAVDYSNVDVLQLDGANIILATDEVDDVDSIRLSLNDFTLTADFRTSSSQMTSTEAPNVSAVSMLKSDPSWGFNGQGQYILYVKDWGDALFLWKREKLQNDSSATYDWYTYSRKATAQPYRKLGVDPRVPILRVQSFPYGQVEPGLVSWTDFQPAAESRGNCDSSSVNVGVSSPYASAGYNFVDCDKYTVWRNAAKPGSYWIEMNQGYVLRSGSREAAYALGFKVKQGVAGSMHDLNLVKFEYYGPDITCKQTDAGRRC